MRPESVAYSGGEPTSFIDPSGSHPHRPVQRRAFLLSPDPIKLAAEISDHMSSNTLADSEGGNDFSLCRDEVSHVSASEEDKSLHGFGVIPDNYTSFRAYTGT